MVTLARTQQQQQWPTGRIQAQTNISHHSPPSPPLPSHRHLSAAATVLQSIKQHTHTYRHTDRETDRWLPAVSTPVDTVDKSIHHQ